MKASTKILRLVQPENGGPRTRSVLDAFAKMYGQGPRLVDLMIKGRMLKRYGRKKGSKWGLPAPKAAA